LSCADDWISPRATIRQRLPFAADVAFMEHARVPLVIQCVFRAKPLIAFLAARGHRCDTGPIQMGVASPRGLLAAFFSRGLWLHRGTSLRRFYSQGRWAG